MSTSVENRRPNRLIDSTSPYLLQHAYNPVQWHEWGTEALQRATKEDKPILVSIGYSSCHWCHVMERESFENDKIAAIMNQHFVCIKVDREERPDIDQIYMDAVQAMGLNGGWPLNVFLTSNQQPFYGGTYFPAKSWAQLLLQLSKTFEGKRDELNRSAAELAQHLNVSDLRRFAREEGPFTKSDFDAAFQQLEAKFDSKFGGLDKAPKFIMPTIWMWLLRYHNLTKNEKTLEMVVLTLRQLAMGGIYDQVGGGFARYSVDGKWFAPHFEKMLYDNAQLVSLYSEAYRSVDDPLFKKVVYETVEWLQREMLHPGGGFYSALDADSEGMEGKFYTWTYPELMEVLGDSATLVAKYYHTTEDGNWEGGRNILYRTDTDQHFMTGHNINKHDLDICISDSKTRLLEERKKRIRPGLDDKILTGWNAMMITGLVDAYNSFGDPLFLSLALKTIGFLERYLFDDHACYRAFKNKRSTTEGFLDDYAFLIKAYLSIYQATFDELWLSKAIRWCHKVIDHFWDEREGYFYFSGSGAEKLIARKKEIFDNVIPSSNSVMGRNLFHLGTLADHENWKQMAIRMASSLRKLVASEPTYTSHWGILALEVSNPFAEIAIVGPQAIQRRHELVKKTLPAHIILGTKDSSNLPLLKDKPVSGEATIYVCYNKMCKLPVNSVKEALALLDQTNV